MGNIESRVAFKTRFASLWSTSDIAADDPIWSALLEPTSGAHEVFSMVRPEEVRRVRDSHPENFETLLVAVSERLSQLTRSAAIGSSTEHQIRGCLRILARVFPVVYEQAADSTRENWAPRFVWKTSSPVIGPLIVDALNDLLLTPGFTIPIAGNEIIWATGIGRRSDPQLSFSESSRLGQNRIEVLRAMLSVLSQPMYSPVSPALDYWTCKSAGFRPEILCSLINFSLAYQPKIWNKPFEMGIAPDLNRHLAALSIVTALLAIVHAPPSPLKNRFRRQIAKIEPDEDLWFLVGRLSERIVESGPGQLPSIVLLWEFVQANHAFKLLVTKAVGTTVNESLLNVVIRSLAMASEKETADGIDAENLARIGSYVLLTLTSDANYAQLVSSTVFRKLVAENVNISLEPSLADVIWNISPYLDLKPRDASRFAEFLSRQPKSTEDLKTDDTREAMATCARVIIDKNPNLIPELRRLQVKYISQPVAWQPLTFVWDSERLKWYSGLIWGLAYRIEQRNSKRTGYDTGVGLWSNTKIQLFKVEVCSAPEVSLRRPQGAVDAAVDVAAGIVSGMVRKFWG